MTACVAEFSGLYTLVVVAIGGNGFGDNECAELAEELPSHDAKNPVDNVTMARQA